jgi:hypothetical protein
MNKAAEDYSNELIVHKYGSETINDKRTNRTDGVSGTLLDHQIMLNIPENSGEYNSRSQG